MSTPSNGHAGGPLSRFVHVLAIAVALLGGVALVLVTLMTVASITGRTIPGIGPVPGDDELAAAGTAFAVFCFLPWCQLRRGHITVDLLAGPLGPRINAMIDTVSSILMTAVGILIAWRLYFGIMDKMEYQETTMILQFPLWWAFAPCMLGAVTFCIVSAWTIATHVRAVLSPTSADTVSSAPVIH